MAPRRRVAAWLIALGACGGAASETKPVATLASSTRAAVAFNPIREAWADPEHTDLPTLRRLLERFIARFPADGLVPLARVYLALVALQQGDTAAADPQLALTEGLPPGTAHDLRTVARARRLRMSGAPEAALELLRPLVGKNVDPVTRAVFEQELTLAALATHRDYEAISYMDAWLRASSDEEKGRALAAVGALAQQIPKEVLVGAIQSMRKQRATLGYGVDIERILAGRLARIATEGGDAELARLLLDSDAGAIVVGGDAGVALSELATSRRGLNVVQGRTLGLLLPTDSPGLRDESADVLRGVMWALGLPRGLRGRANARASDATADGGVAEPRPDAQAPVRSACATPEPAPPLDDPRPREGLRLVTRDDSGSADRTEVSLDELVGEGAAIVIAGLDAQTAARALGWADSHRVPLIALVPPLNPLAGALSFGFVLGEPRASVLDALVRAAPALASERAAPVIDLSEVALYPPQGGPVGALTLLPPISCDIPPTMAGDPRFPIAEWDRDKIHDWLVSGSPSCAADVVSELSAAHARGVVALLLEAAALPAHPPALRVISASAGVVPDAATSERGDDELRRFRATLGPVSFWTALGRDAATLARVAMAELPTETASDPPAVAERRTHARDLLVAARVRLWSTEATGWTDTHTIKRTVCAIEASTQTAATVPR
jgi:hypothetical protein